MGRVGDFRIKMNEFFWIVSTVMVRDQNAQ